LTIGRAGELIRRRLTQKKCLEFLQQFPNMEFKSFLDLGYDHSIHQTISTLNQPESEIKIDSDPALIKKWFMGLCEPLRESQLFLVSVHDFVRAGWVEAYILNIDILWDIWEKSREKCFYIVDEKKNIFHFFKNEYEYEFFRGQGS
jgi:hypothetical protein